MIESLSSPWPWWIAGPLLGLVVPLLLLYGGKLFGISSSLRHISAAVFAPRLAYFQYDWRSSGTWNLLFVLGLVIGGVLAGTVLAHDGPVGISEATWTDLAALGVARQERIAPAELFAWEQLGTVAGATALIAGGFLLGFGARWAGGCTSGHGISGLASLQLPSLVAVLGFFAGGLVVTHLVLPAMLGGAHG